jgi:hypothetical protein
VGLRLVSARSRSFEAIWCGRFAAARERSRTRAGRAARRPDALAGRGDPPHRLGQQARVGSGTSRSRGRPDNAGSRLREVQDAPDRPGKEFVPSLGEPDLSRSRLPSSGRVFRNGGEPCGCRRRTRSGSRGISIRTSPAVSETTAHLVTRRTAPRLVRRAGAVIHSAYSTRPMHGVSGRKHRSWSDSLIGGGCCGVVGGLGRFRVVG